MSEVETNIQRHDGGGRRSGPGKVEFRVVLEMLDSIVLLGVLAFAFLFLITAFLRLGYPFELEWMEGGTLQHVQRLLDGQSLYAAPSIEYTAFRYGPLYYLIGALFSMIGGGGFMPLRLLSIFSTLGCLYVIYHWIKVVTGESNSGLLGAALFVATYGISDAWFDLARVDMLFMYFLLLTLCYLHTKTGLRGTIIAGLFAFLSFWSKQAALGYLAPVALLILIFDFKRGLAFVLTLTGLVISSTLVWDLLSDGWYSFYVFELGQSIKLVGPVWGKSFDFVVVQLGWHFFGACLATVYLLYDQLVRKRAISEPWFFWVLIPWTIGLTWFVKMGLGSWTNTLLPMFGVMAVSFGMAWSQIENRISSFTGRRRKIAGSLVASVLLLQFAVLIYDPVPHLPTDEDQIAGEELVTRIGAIDGEVFIPFHSYLAGMAGKKVLGHEMAIDDVLKRAPKEQADSLANEIRTAISSQRFEVIILDLHFFTSEIEQHYVRTGTVFDKPGLFNTRSGFGIRPETVYKKSDRLDN